jgi:hypothetical protein
VAAPRIVDASPAPGCSGVVLRQRVRISFDGPIDPASFSEGTFALFGPGDAAPSTGPGTILTVSGLRSDPYPTIDGVVVREHVSGVYAVETVSGLPVAVFYPGVPLRPDTVYQAVLLGADCRDVLGPDYPCVTSDAAEPLASSFLWSFATTQLNAAEPPAVPAPEPVVVDQTDGTLVLRREGTADPMRLVASWPAYGEYAVPSGLPCVVLEFSKPLRPDLVSSGILRPEDLKLNLSPLLGEPNLETNPSFVPSGLEVSGRYLKVWL